MVLMQTCEGKNKAPKPSGDLLEFTLPN